MMLDQPAMQWDAVRRRQCATEAHRCFGRKGPFGLHEVNGWSWRLREPPQLPGLAEILSDPDGFLKSRAELLGPGRSSTVGRAAGWVVKRYRPRKRGALMRSAFRESRAVRVCRIAYHLELLGLPAPVAVGVATRRVGPFVRSSYLVMREIVGAQTLRQQAQVGSLSADVVRQTAAMIARLHAAGFTQRDLRPENILVDAQGRAWLVDLDGVRFVERVHDRQAGRELRRLAAYANAAASPWSGVFLREYSRVRGWQRLPHAWRELT